MGKSGNWLLDPANITVGLTGSGNLSQGGNVSDTGSTITISTATIDAASTNVVLAANNSITVNSPIAMSVSGVGITFEGAGANLTAGPSLGTTLNANITTNGTVAPNTGTGGDITIHGATVLGADVTVNSSARVTFNGTIDGNHALTASGYAVILNGAVGGAVPLTALTVTANSAVSDIPAITVASNVTTANGAVTFHGRTTIPTVTPLTINTGTGTLDFDGDLWGVFSEAQINLTIAGSGDTIFGGQVVGNHDNASALTTGTGRTTLTGNVGIAGAVTFRGPVTLAADTVVTANNITFCSTVDGGYNLSALTNSPATTFVGLVGATTPLAGLTTLYATFDSNITTANGNVRAVGSSLLGGNVAINAGTGNVTLATVDGAYSLTLNNSGSTSIAAVGLTTPLTGLTTGPGATILGGTITTANGPVTIGGPANLTVFVNISAGTGAVTFDSTVDGAVGALNITGSGPTTFGGAIGAINPLTRLTTGTGTTTFDANVATANGAITVNGATLLGGNVTMSTGTGSVNFNGPVDGDYGLTVNSSGNEAFGTVGGTIALASLAAGTGTVTLGGNITTANGAFTVHGTTTILNTSPIIINTGTGALDFDGPLTGTIGNEIFNLTIAGSGDTIFGGQVMGQHGASSLTTGTGRTTLTGNVGIAGAVTFRGPVTLAADTVVTANNITFCSTVDGGYNLSALTNSPATTFVGLVGATTPLAGLTTLYATFDSNITTANGNVRAVGSSLLGGNVAINAGTGNVTLATVDGAYSLTLNNSGSTSIAGRRPDHAPDRPDHGARRHDPGRHHHDGQRPGHHRRSGESHRLRQYQRRHGRGDVRQHGRRRGRCAQHHRQRPHDLRRCHRCHQPADPSDDGHRYHDLRRQCRDGQRRDHRQRRHPAGRQRHDENRYRQREFQRPGRRRLWPDRQQQRQ